MGRDALGVVSYGQKPQSCPLGIYITVHRKDDVP